MYKKCFIFLVIVSTVHALDIDHAAKSLGLTPLNMAALSQAERKQFNISDHAALTEKEYDAACTRIAASLLLAGTDLSTSDNNGMNVIQRAKKNKCVMPQMYELIKAAHVSDEWNWNPRSGLTWPEFKAAQAVLDKYR